MANEKKDLSLDKARNVKPDRHKKDKKENFFVRMGKGSSRWFRDMRGELKKVVWPTRKQLINNSVVAIVIMAVSSVVVWGFDQVAYSVVRFFIDLGK
jgi:preprotein translocase subunit SecE